MNNCEYEAEKAYIAGITFGIVVGVVISVTIVTILSLLCVSNYRAYDARLVETFVSPIELSTYESSKLDRALVAWSMGDKKKVTIFVSDLQKSGKSGILPPLPSGAGTGMLDDIVYVKHLEKLVLLPKK